MTENQEGIYDPGTKVICQLFNTPDDRYYGDKWLGVVLDESPTNEKMDLVVTREDHHAGKQELHYNEVLEVVNKEQLAKPTFGFSYKERNYTP